MSCLCGLAHFLRLLVEILELHDGSRLGTCRFPLRQHLSHKLSVRITSAPCQVRIDSTIITARIRHTGIPISRLVDLLHLDPVNVDSINHLLQTTVDQHLHGFISVIIRAIAISHIQTILHNIQVRFPVPRHHLDELPLHQLDHVLPDTVDTSARAVCDCLHRRIASWTTPRETEQPSIENLRTRTQRIIDQDLYRKPHK